LAEDTLTVQVVAVQEEVYFKNSSSTAITIQARGGKVKYRK
jgi:hypothetical protein